MAEPGYIFTHLASAVAFLQNLDAKQLSISQEEFEQGLQRYQAIARQKRYQETITTGTDGELESSFKTDDPYSEISANAIRKARHTYMTPLPLDKQLKRESSEFIPNDPSLRWIHPAEAFVSQDQVDLKMKFKFVAREAASLSLGEVTELLTEYKALVATYQDLILKSSNKI